ncbi:MAG: tRNA (adenosine(37)-N6)-dimethylallyltransferase MiaA [Alphaproteobacteria bacterium]
MVSTPVVIVAGPTASGKSALALDLAEVFDGVVVNADSMQVYRELRILTARPGAAEEARAPHRLYGVLPAAEACSAARWRDMALAEIAAVREAGRLPILVGGTGLYFRALETGFAAVPDVSAEVRAAARARHAELGGEAFRAALAGRDPEMAARLAPGDSQRLIRAWEVIEATGVSLAEWQRRGTPEDGPSPSTLSFVLAPPRAALYAACDARFAAMVEAGALAEVAALDALGLAPELPAMKALGVRELRRHLAGELSLDAAIAAAQQATRNYAKRQLTWFRHQMPEARLVELQYSQDLAPRLIEEIGRFLLTTAG